VVGGGSEVVTWGFALQISNGMTWIAWQTHGHQPQATTNLTIVISKTTLFEIDLCFFCMYLLQSSAQHWWTSQIAAALKYRPDR
jgi:hypothetical protein